MGRIILILAFYAGIVFLQIYLSKRENKWPGLILPVIAFIISFVVPLNMVAPGEISFSFIVAMLIGFLGANLPTLLFLLIYFVGREKLRRKEQLEKMNIQDLD